MSWNSKASVSAGAGHARQFVVEAEEVLVGDGGECLGFLFDGHAFFDFDGLVQAV